MPSGVGGASPPAASAAITGWSASGSPAARAGRASPSTTTSSSVVEHGPLALVERRPVDTAGAGQPARGARGRRPRPARRVDHPPADGRRPALAGEQLQLVGVDPAPLGDDPLDAGGPGRARDAGSDRRHVEHLAAADRLVATGLAQHVAVARAAAAAATARCRRTSAGRAGRDRVRAEHAQAHGVLAGADVGEVGAAPRHGVVERGEHRRARRRTRSSAASGRARRRRRRGASARVLDAGQVEGDAVARPDRVDDAAERLDRPHPGRPAAGLDGDVVAGRRSSRRSACR